MNDSLYGIKPDACSARFLACGECNIYPCLTGRPNEIADGIFPLQDLLNSQVIGNPESLAVFDDSMLKEYVKDITPDE